MGGVDKVKLVITGFEDKSQIQAFVNWYEGQGEQDIDIWLEADPECTCESLLTGEVRWVDEETMEMAVKATRKKLV